MLAVIKKTSLILTLLFGLLAPGYTQTTLDLGSNITKNGGGVQCHDYTIGSNVNYIRIKLGGADGGNTEVSGAFGCNHPRKGGSGATIGAIFTVDGNSNTLSPGGQIRIVPGERGAGESRPCSEAANGGGGGSSGVIYKAPGATSWVPLAVAGGGGGAISDVVLETGSGRSEDGFGASNADFPGNGSAGTSQTYLNLPVGGGGAGYNAGTEGAQSPFSTNFTVPRCGASGGSPSSNAGVHPRNGGAGFSGGGWARSGGGGGGGYTGGSSGAVREPGRGGTSYLVPNSTYQRWVEFNDAGSKGEGKENQGYVSISAPALTWTGAVSNQWTTPANWDPQVIPNSSSVVEIPPTSNDPVIPAIIGTQQVDALLIGTGAKLTIGSGGRLEILQSSTASVLGAAMSVYGGFENNGTLQLGSATTAIPGYGMLVLGTVDNFGTMEVDNYQNYGILLGQTAKLNNKPNSFVRLGTKLAISAGGVSVQAGGEINNQGTLQASNNTSAFGVHLQFGGVCNNLAGGVLDLDKTSTALMLEDGMPQPAGQASQFNNAGTVNIDESYYGLRMGAGNNAFHNQTGGQIKMGANYQLNNGIYLSNNNPNNSITNDGSLEILNIDLLYGAGFSGDAVSIDNATLVNNGYWETNDEQFLVNLSGGSFTNGPCAMLEVNGDRILTSTNFTNNGFIVHNYNGGLFTNLDGVNNGAISYSRNSSVGSIENNNNGIIYKPKSGTCSIPNLFTIANNNGVTLGNTFYTDNTLTTSAATYSNNTLFPSNTNINNQTLFISATQANSGCSIAVPVRVTLTDNTDPTITNCPSNIQVTLDPGTCTKIVNYSAVTATDNCGNPLVNLSSGIASGQPFPGGTTTNTFTVTDAVGNSVTCTFDVTVSDTELPIASCPGNMTKLADPGSCGTVVSYVVSTSDNCAVVSASQTNGLASGATFPVGVTTNSFTATDAAGNSASCSFTVTVNDTELPMISCPANITLNNDQGDCGAIVNYNNVSYSDNCSSTRTGSLASLTNGIPIYNSNRIVIYFDIIVGSTNVRVNGFDINMTGAGTNLGIDVYAVPGSFLGNQTNASFWGAKKSSGTAISATANGFNTINLNNGIALKANTRYAIAIHTDNFRTNTNNGLIGPLPLQYSNSDLALTFGSGSTGLFQGTVGINQLIWNLAVNYEAGVPYMEQTQGLESGESFSIGTTTNEFTVTDGSGNSASCAFTVTVNDTENPGITCPANIAVTNDPGQCGANVSYPAITTSDNCTGESLSQPAGQASGTVFPGGTTTNSFTVTDASGNSATCSFSVTVNDNEAPEISCPTSIMVNNDPGICGAQVTYSVTTTDNCSGESLNQTAGQASGSVFAVGTTTNDFTVTDASGNSATCAFTVTVNDTEDPVLICPADMTVNNDPGTCDAVVNYLLNGSDNCFIKTFLVLEGKLPGSTFPVGTTTNRFSATDPAGNTTTCSFTLEVIDNTNPGITCPSTITQSNDAGVCGAVVTYTVSSSDNCTGESINQTAGQASGSTFPVGTTTNSFTVTDASGNTAECSFDVTITDDENPSISCPTSISLGNDPGQCGRVVTYLTPQGTDNCNSSTAQTAGLGSGSTFPLGVTTEVYTVTDASGNSANCSFSITITDGEQPVINLLGVNPLELCVGDTYVEAGATATDNCDGTVSQNISINNSAVNTAQEGTYYVTYDVTDANGNSAIQLTRTVIVNRSPNQLAQQNCGSCGQIRFTFCQDEPTQDLESLLLGNANYLAGATFNWYADNSGSQGGAIAKPTVNTASPSTHFYWVSQQIGSCEGLARRVRVRVKKASLVVFDLPNAGCGTTSLDLAAYVSDSRNFATGYEFWQGNPSQGGSYLGQVSATKGQVDFGQNVIINLPAQSTTYYAEALNRTGCQTGDSDEVSVGGGASLAPIASQTVSSGDLVSVSFSAPGADRIVWYNLNNPNIGILGMAGFGPLSFTAFNNGTSPLTAQLFAIAYQGGCASTPQYFSITVNPGANTRQSRGNSLELAASKLNAHDVQLSWDLRYEHELVRFVVEKKNVGNVGDVRNSEDGKDNVKNERDVKDGSYSPPLSGHVRPEGGAGGGSGVTSDDWEEIGEIAWEGDGYYDFVDRGGMSNVTKYRLKLVHADGRAIWSEEVEVTFDYLDSEHFQLYPNPSGGRFSLRAPGALEGEWDYKLSDGLGRTLLTGKLKGRETAFDISSQPSGYYFLVITSPEGKRYLRKVAKR